MAELPHTLQLQEAFFLFGVKLPWCILGEGIAQRCSVKQTKLAIFTGPYNLHHARLHHLEKKAHFMLRIWDLEV